MMVEAEYLFFQRVRERIDQRIREGNYDEAAVNMQKCMEYIANSLDCENHNYRAESLWDVMMKIKSRYPEYPMSRHEWGRIMSYCSHQLHLEEKEIDYRLLMEETKIVQQLLEKIIVEYLNRQDLARCKTAVKDTNNNIKEPIIKPNDSWKKKKSCGDMRSSKKSIINPEKILRSETDTDNNLDGIFGFDGELTLDTTLKRDETEKKHKEKAVFQEEVETMLL